MEQISSAVIPGMTSLRTAGGRGRIPWTQAGAEGGTDAVGWHPGSAVHHHHRSPHQQALLLCQGHQISPCLKHRAARFSERGRTTEEQQRPKIKGVPLQEWPDPGRAPHTEVLSCHRPHVCEGKGMHSRAHAVPAALPPSPLQFHNCLK